MRKLISFLCLEWRKREERKCEEISSGKFRVYLDLGKLEGKKKVWKVIFFPLFDLRKVKRKKNREESCKENFSYYKVKIFLPNMRGK